MSHGKTIVLVVALSVVAVITSLTLVVAGGLYFFKDELVAYLIPPEPVLDLPPPVSHEDIPDMVETTIPAVASVVITADVPIIEQYYENWNPFGGFFGGRGSFQIPRQRQVGTEKQEIGGGTGFFVSADGYLITNRHVVDDTRGEFSVRLNDGTTYPVTVVAKDPMLDIAVLKVNASSTFSYLTFARDDVRLGETVVAIGNALAEFPNTVSVGVVSGLSRDIVASDGFGSEETLEGLIQTDAAINRGNSGGPLLNLRGEVVGVNVAVANGSENIGFALPANMVASVYAGVAESGRIVRPFLGVRYLQITDEIAKTNNLPVAYGVLVVRGETRAELAVMPGSPADKAGLEENDIILAINGEQLDGSKTFATKLREFAPGDTITLRVLHNGEENDVSVVLEEAPTE